MQVRTIILRGPNDVARLDIENPSIASKFFDRIIETNHYSERDEDSFTFSEIKYFDLCICKSKYMGIIPIVNFRKQDGNCI